MGKSKLESRFVCQSCGHSERKWHGRCSSCQAWNSFVEEVSGPPLNPSQSFVRDSLAGPSLAMPITEVDSKDTERHALGFPEFDRILGGGFVPGGVVLIAGEPGCGKSTLLLMASSMLAKKGRRVLFVSGEESTAQIRLSASRLAALHPELFLLSETNIAHALKEADRLLPDLLVVDSVQTVFSDALDSASGSVAQIREVTAQIVHFAKGKNRATMLVGHVTKDGQIAGPRLLEHMVDTVLYFEQSRNDQYRMLRAHKNRFGSTNEIGLFEMSDQGLSGISNPSAFFLAERPKDKPGSAILGALEGSRPLLVEVQALCVESLFGNPRRTCVGIDQTRCAVIAAVLEKHAGLGLSRMDLFINVAGGIHIEEPASDVTLALAIASSYLKKPLPSDLISFGELGLSGELRSIHRAQDRLKEAHRMGFRRALLPKSLLGSIQPLPDFQTLGADSIDECLRLILRD